MWGGGWGGINTTIYNTVEFYKYTPIEIMNQFTTSNKNGRRG